MDELTGPRLTISLVCLAAACLFQSGRAAAADYPFELSAEYVIYVVDEKTVNATGDVRLVFQGMNIRADTLSVSMRRYWVSARGRVVVESLGKTLEGDAFVFDMTLFEGMIFQGGDLVQRIYFRGQSLDNVSSLTNIPEDANLRAEPADSTINIVCDRIRISSGGKFEAWNVSVWIAGIRVLSVSYYTNLGKGISNATVSLNQIRYSSKRKWMLGGHVRYMKRPGYQGYMSVGFNSMASKPYSLSLTQNFQLSRATGTLGLTNIGNKRLGASLGFHTRLFERVSGRFGFTTTKASTRSFSASLSRHGGQSSWLVDVTYLKYLARGGKVISSNISWDRPVKYLPRYGVGYSLRAYHTHRESYPYGGHYNNLSFSPSLFKSSIRLADKTYLSASTSFMGSVGDKGSNAFSYQSNITMQQRFRRTDMFSLHYSFSGSTSLSTFGRRYSSRSRTLRSALAFGASGIWSLRLGARYDLVRDRTTGGDVTFSRWVNPRLRFDMNWNYDFISNRTTYDRYALTYDLYGLHIHFDWYNTTREWVVDFGLPF